MPRGGRRTPARRAGAGAAKGPQQRRLPGRRKTRRDIWIARSADGGRSFQTHRRGRTDAGYSDAPKIAFDPRVAAPVHAEGRTDRSKRRRCALSRPTAAHFARPRSLSLCPTALPRCPFRRWASTDGTRGGVWELLRGRCPPTGWRRGVGRRRALRPSQAVPLSVEPQRSTAVPRLRRTMAVRGRRRDCLVKAPSSLVASGCGCSRVTR